MLYPYCMPPGMPRIHLRGQAMQIVQGSGYVYLIFEAGPSILRIHTDGRKHIDGIPPSFMGDTIGWWEGETLVSETVNISGFGWLDSAGHPKSDALRVTQRIRRVTDDTLEVDFLFTDPKAYTRPWGAKKSYKLRPDWELMEYIICESQMREQYTNEAFR
jgi:hypothetical protein